MFRGLKATVSVIFLLGISSCGYHATTSEDTRTISIPYVEGDQQGQLTAEIIRRLEETGLYEFVRSGGDLVLTVSMVGDQKDVVGFSYDRTEKKGKIEQNLMATENRRSLTAQITLSEGEKAILGPLKVTAFGEYDYVDVNSLKTLSFINENGKREKVINFSLGQLDSIEGAEDNEKVAPKILRESLKKGDLVVGIAASGVTPFVWSALRQAKKLKAKTRKMLTFGNLIKYFFYVV